MGALGILGTSSLNFHTMLEETGMDKAVQRNLTMKYIYTSPSDALITLSVDGTKNGTTQI